LLVSSGGGELFTVTRAAADPARLGAGGGYRFDNHIARI
jgi:hypothetical protein